MSTTEPSPSSASDFVDVERLEIKIEGLKREASDVAAVQARLETMIANGKVDAAELAAVDHRIEQLQLKSDHISAIVTRILTKLERE